MREKRWKKAVFLARGKNTENWGVWGREFTNGK
jgi:hypothetical protein